MSTFPFQTQLFSSFYASVSTAGIFFSLEVGGRELTRSIDFFCQILENSLTQWSSTDILESRVCYCCTCCWRWGGEPGTVGGMCANACLQIASVRRRNDGMLKVKMFDMAGVNLCEARHLFQMSAGEKKDIQFLIITR